MMKNKKIYIYNFIIRYTKNTKPKSVEEKFIKIYFYQDRAIF